MILNCKIQPVCCDAKLRCWHFLVEKIHGIHIYKWLSCPFLSKFYISIQNLSIFWQKNIKIRKISQKKREFCRNSQSISSKYTEHDIRGLFHHSIRMWPGVDLPAAKSKAPMGLQGILLNYTQLSLNSAF